MSHAHFFRLKILVRYNGHNQRLFLLQNSKLKTQPHSYTPSYCPLTITAVNLQENYNLVSAIQTVTHFK